MEEVTSVGLGDWTVGWRERVGPPGLWSLCPQEGRRPGLLEKGYAWPGTAELEVPGGLQAQSSDRHLGEGRGLGGARKDEAPERGCKEQGGFRTGPRQNRKSSEWGSPWGSWQAWTGGLCAPGPQGPAGVGGLIGAALGTA